jgi:prophage antirepressor-like protein
MLDLIEFDYENAQVRVMMKDGSPWFAVKDVCAILGIGNPSQSVANFPPNQTCITSNDTYTKLGNRSLLFVSEAGLYKLIFKSRKRGAEKFQDWVCDEILPAIRKQGFYGIPSPDQMEAYTYYQGSWVPFTEKHPNAVTFALKWMGVPTEAKQIEQVEPESVVPLPATFSLGNDSTEALFDALKVMSQNLNRQGLAMNKHLKMVDRLQDIQEFGAEELASMTAAMNELIVERDQALIIVDNFRKSVPELERRLAATTKQNKDLTSEVYVLKTKLAALEPKPAQTPRKPYHTKRAHAVNGVGSFAMLRSADPN